MASFDVVGALRRIRRIADLSQRELAERCGVAPSVIAHAETGRRPLSLELLVRAAAVAGLRLTLVDAEEREVTGMADRSVRDAGGRRFPAHLDTRYGDIGWWHDDGRHSRVQPWYTFDRERSTRDYWRGRFGTPEDHQLPQPGDSPADRAARRRQEALRRRAEERERRFQAGELRQAGPDFVCTCPAGCDPVAERHADVHVESCSCRCDVA